MEKQCNLPIELQYASSGTSATLFYCWPPHTGDLISLVKISKIGLGEARVNCSEKKAEWIRDHPFFLTLQHAAVSLYQRTINSWVVFRVKESGSVLSQYRASKKGKDGLIELGGGGFVDRAGVNRFPIGHHRLPDGNLRVEFGIIAPDGSQLTEALTLSIDELVSLPYGREYWYAVQQEEEWKHLYGSFSVDIETGSDGSARAIKSGPLRKPKRKPTDDDSLAQNTTEALVASGSDSPLTSELLLASRSVPRAPVSATKRLRPVSVLQTPPQQQPHISVVETVSLDIAQFCQSARSGLMALLNALPLNSGQVEQTANALEGLMESLLRGSVRSHEVVLHHGEQHGSESDGENS